MFRIAIIVLSLLSVGAYAQDNHSINSNTVANKPTENEFYKEFVHSHQETIKLSKLYKYLLTMGTSSPGINEAVLTTMRLNETSYTHQKLDELVKAQKITNELLVQLIQKKGDDRGKGEQLSKQIFDS